MPTSARAPAIGLPTFSDSFFASSSVWSSTSVAKRRNIRARSVGATARHAGNAAFARATAASVSSTPADSISASVSSVAGLTTPLIRADRIEQLRVGAGLRMPEHAEREPPLGILQALDRAVVGPRDLAQTFADGA